MEKILISEEILIAAIEQADRALLEEIVDTVICAYSRRYPEYDFYFCRERRMKRCSKPAEMNTGKTLQIHSSCDNIGCRKISQEEAL